MTTDPTPNLGLSRPVAGDTAWTDDYHEAMEAIDAHPGITVVADAASRPATPWTGQKIFQVDIATFFGWDGSAWVPEGTEVFQLTSSTVVNGAKAMLVARPGADADLETSGLLIKTDAAIGELSGQDYSEGQGIVLLSQSDAPLTANTTVAQNISSTTDTTPVQVNTAVAHGASTGDVLRVTGTGIAALDNQWWKVTVVDMDSVTLDGSTAPGLTASQGYLFGNRSPVLLRIDPKGGIGSGASMHFATGLRGQPGQAFTPGTDTGIWIDPASDVIGLLITNPTTTEWPDAPTAPFLLVRDVRGTPYDLLEVDENGVLRSNKGAVFKGRAVGDSPLILERIASQTGTLFVARTAAGAARLSITGNVDNMVLAGLADNGSTQVIHFGSGDSPLFGIRFFSDAKTAGSIAAFLKSGPSATADNTRWVDSSNAIGSRIDKGLRFATRVTSAPADGDVANSEVVVHSTTDGEPRFKAKSSGGTVRTGTLAGADAGLLSARPAASAVVPGSIYLATDVEGGTAYRSDGTSWAQLAPGVDEVSGKRLDYAEVTADQGPITSAVDLTGLSITFTAPTRPVRIAGAAIGSNDTADNGLQLMLTDDANNFLDLDPRVSSLAAAWTGKHRVEIHPTLTPGNEYTFKLRAARYTAGNATMRANASWPAFIGAWVE